MSVDVSRLEKRLEKSRKSEATLKRRLADAQSSEQFFRERCLQLELASNYSRVRNLPKVARDTTTYTGDELIALTMTLNTVQDQLAAAVAELERHKRDHAARPHAAEDIDNDYGLRWSPNLKLGPTSDYK